MREEVVIVSAVRTPVGKAYKGTLRATRPDDLGAIAIKGALDIAQGFGAFKTEAAVNQAVITIQRSLLDANPFGIPIRLLQREPKRVFERCKPIT